MADEGKKKKKRLVPLIVDLCGIVIKKIARKIRARREKKSKR